MNLYILYFYIFCGRPYMIIFITMEGPKGTMGNILTFNKTVPFIFI